jgi:polynucleotide 5'-hydroxyl-kinase GRC3/NOL9
MWFRPAWSSAPSPASLADPVLHAPPEWVEAAEHICRHAPARVLVIGARDTGKSTFCRFLYDAATQLGRSAALLDTDVGQKTVGPPACVTLKDRYGLKLAFVGATNPVLGWRRLVEGTRRLAHEADADLLVVNTSGLLGGPGRRLKAAKIDAVQPGLLIALGDDPALQAIIGDRPERPVLRLPLSPEARRKTDGERRAARREAFGAYFAQASILTLDKGMLTAVEPDAPLSPRLLVGLADKHGNDLGLGLLIGWRDGSTPEILSPVAQDSIGQIALGSLCLDQNFSEAAPQGTSGGGIG